MAEPGGRSTVSVQLDGMDQAKFALPRSLLVSADNITREYKNQHFATFMASQVATEKFEATEVQFLQAGHTHNEQDQRFSTVASLLSRRRAPDNVFEDRSRPGQDQSETREIQKGMTTRKHSVAILDRSSSTVQPSAGLALRRRPAPEHSARRRHHQRQPAAHSAQSEPRDMAEKATPPMHRSPLE